MASDYDQVKEIEKWKNRVLYASTFVTLFLTMNEKYKISENYIVLKDYVDVIVGFNAIFIIFYVIADILSNYLFARAEKNRVFRYIDNSFNTNFADQKISGYFSQDYLNPGFYKMCVNCFENTFFTFNIAKKMLIPVGVKLLVIVGIFMFSATVGEKGMVRYITEAILPLAFIQSAIRMILFVINLDNLRETFASFFNSVKDSNFKDREPEALKNVITYEKLLAWASIPTDEKIYKKLNPELSKQWEEMKIEYAIQQVN